MKDLYDRIVEDVQASNHTRLDDSEDRCTRGEAEDIIRGWDSLELLRNISFELNEMLQEARG